MTIEPKEGPEGQVPVQDGPGAEIRAAAVHDADADERVVPPSVEERLRDELAATRDQLLRARADLDNQRKRMDRERQQWRTSYVSGCLREFLAVVDNLDRALESEEASADDSGDRLADAARRHADFRTGVEMIQRQMMSVLRKFDVEPVDSLETVFDPNLHEAVAQELRPDVDQPTVRQELQKGYTMRSTLLRPAMVVVAMPAPAASSGGSPDGIGTSDGAEAESDAAAGGC